MTPYTLSIIGAGPAGSLAAYRLARAGHAVTVIEQHPFPRDKVCGEMLSALGQTVLQHAGLLDRLRDHLPAAIHFAQLHTMDGAVARIALPAPLMGISRHAMDAALLDAAADAGAAVRHRVRCESLNPLTLRDLSTNTLEHPPADVILVADGKGSLLPNPPPTTGDIGLKTHFTGVHLPPDTVFLFAQAGHYVGVGPIENNRWNVALNVPAAKLRAYSGDPAKLWTRLRAENPALDRAFRDATQQSATWLATPLPRFAVRTDWPANVIPLGNAVAALEPIGGEGMGLALASADLAVDALLAAGHRHLPRRVIDREVLDRKVLDFTVVDREMLEPDALIAASDRGANRTLPSHAAVDLNANPREVLDRNALIAAYRRLWRTRRPACRLAAVVLSRPALASAAVGFLAATDHLTRPLLRLAGKADHAAFHPSITVS